MTTQSGHSLTSPATSPRTRTGRPGGADGHAGGRPLARASHNSQREYARWRARQIAYGRWQPWTDATAVRQHVQLLRRAGASYHAIAEAAGVSAMMVHRLQRGEPGKGRPIPSRVRASHALRLLAVTPALLRDGTGRRDAGGARLRLRALTAMGHPAVSLALYLDVPPRVIWDLLRGQTRTVTDDLHTAVSGLYDRIWNLRPPERTGAERRAATMARTRAARNNWAPPAALDDDLIDDPAYRPRAQWRPATGVGVAPPPVRPPSGQAATYRPEAQQPGLGAAS